MKLKSLVLAMAATGMVLGVGVASAAGVIVKKAREPGIAPQLPSVPAAVPEDAAEAAARRRALARAG